MKNNNFQSELKIPFKIRERFRKFLHNKFGIHWFWEHMDDNYRACFFCGYEQKKNFKGVWSEYE